MLKLYTPEAEGIHARSPARQRLGEGGQLVHVQEDPGEVADEEDEDDGEEDGGQAVLLATHQADVTRVHVV